MQSGGVKNCPTGSAFGKDRNALSALIPVSLYRSGYIATCPFATSGQMRSCGLWYKSDFVNQCSALQFTLLDGHDGKLAMS